MADKMLVAVQFLLGIISIFFGVLVLMDAWVLVYLVSFYFIIAGILAIAMAIASMSSK